MTAKKKTTKKEALKPGAISDFLAVYYNRRQLLIGKLLRLVPHSLPDSFKDCILYYALDALISGKGSYSASIERLPSIGFSAKIIFMRDIALLQKAWKNQIAIECWENPTPRLVFAITFKTK